MGVGCSLYIKKKGGWAPLMTASCLGHIHVVNRLLQCRDIDYNVQNGVKMFCYCNCTLFFFLKALLLKKGLGHVKKEITRS